MAKEEKRDPLPDAELSLLERCFRELPDLEPVHREDAEKVALALSELRRLRGLIFSAAPLLVGPEGWCFGCDQDLSDEGGATHTQECPLGALQREAGK